MITSGAGKIGGGNLHSNVVFLWAAFRDKVKVFSNFVVWL